MNAWMRGAWWGSFLWMGAGLAAAKDWAELSDQARSQIMELTGSSEPQRRADAARSLGGMDPSVIPWLVRAVREDSEVRVRAAAAESLGNLGPRAAEGLTLAIADQAAAVRLAALASLRGIRFEGLWGVLQRAWEDPDTEIRRTIVWNADHPPLLPAQTLSLVKRGLADADPVVREAAVMRLWIFRKEPWAREAFLQAAKDPSPRVRLRAVTGFVSATEGSVRMVSPVVVSLLADADSQIRTEALGFFREHPFLEALPWLEKAAADPQSGIRTSALGVIQAWGSLGFPALIKLSRHPSEEVRQAALYALGGFHPGPKPGEEEPDLPDPLQADMEAMQRREILLSLSLALGDPSPKIRLAGLQAAKAHSEHRAAFRAAVLRALADPNDEVRLEASLSVTSVAEASDIPALMKILAVTMKGWEPGKPSDRYGYQIRQNLVRRVLELGAPEVIPDILRHPASDVREEGIRWILNASGGSRRGPNTETLSMLTLVISDPDRNVRRRAVEGLGWIQDPIKFKWLAPLAKETDSWVVDGMGRIFEESPTPEALPFYLSFVKYKFHAGIRAKAVRAVGRFPLNAKGAFGAMLDVLKDPFGPHVDAILVLANWKNIEAVSSLLAFLKSLKPQDPQKVGVVLLALGRIGDPQCLEVIGSYVAQGSPEVRIQAIAALGMYGPAAKTAAPLLLQALADPNPKIRAAAVASVGHLKDEAYRSDLEKMTKDPNGDVRVAATVALEELPVTVIGIAEPPPFGISWDETLGLAPDEVLRRRLAILRDGRVPMEERVRRWQTWYDAKDPMAMVILPEWVKSPLAPVRLQGLELTRQTGGAGLSLWEVALGDPDKAVKGRGAALFAEWIQKQMLLKDATAEWLPVIARQGVAGRKGVIEAMKEYRACQSLLFACFADEDPSVREAVVGVMGAWKEPASKALMLRGAKDPNATVRQKALAALGLWWWEDPDVVPVIEAALNDPELPVKIFAIGWLGGRQSPVLNASLAGLSRDPRPEVRKASVYVVGRLGPAGLSLLMERMEDANAEIRAASFGQVHMVFMTLEAAWPYFAKGMVDISLNVRASVLEALRGSRDLRALAIYSMALRDRSGEIRWQAVEGVGRFQHPQAATALAGCLSDPMFTESQRRLIVLLEQMGSEAVGAVPALALAWKEKGWVDLPPLAMACGTIKCAQSLSLLMAMWDAAEGSKDPGAKDQVRRARGAILGGLGAYVEEPPVRSLLEAATSHQDPGVRQMAKWILDHPRSPAPKPPNRGPAPPPPGPKAP